jgi:phosphatidate cytidylyltransferase
MIGRVVALCISAFLVGGVGLYAGSRNQEPAVRRNRLIKFLTYFCVVNLVLLCAVGGAGVLLGMMAALVLLGAHELFRALTHSEVRRPLRLVAGALYAIISTGSLLFVWHVPPKITVVVYLVVCAFDGFSQVSGQIFGKHRLAPTISPGKTIEGSAGGLLFALAMALLLRSLADWSAWQSAVVGCFIVLTALTGDLLASFVKRRCNIKDFGSLIPGHGGVLDRFDSFLFASAACLLAAAMLRIG